jgi:O-antigen/teichoic acid export membrane protein
MTTRASFFRGGVKLGIGQIVAQASSFVKSLVVARLISPADFGIAAIFSLTFSLLEMTSNLSAQTLLVQAPDGDEPRLEKTAQFIQATRGCTNAALIFLLSGPVSRLFGAPQTRLAFAALALVPLIRGFNHLDIYRLQRQMRFGPSVSVDVASNLLVTLAAFPLAYSLRNYWAMLWLLVAQAISYLVGSHVVAERRYGWAWDRVFTKRIFHFGWPLLINGLLLYGIFEGDRVLIGSAHRLCPRAKYTLTDLGVYSVAFALAQAPSTTIGNICLQLFLPFLSHVQKFQCQFQRRYTACLHIVSLLAAMVAVGFILVGGKVILLAYGRNYADGGLYIGWLGAMWALRIFRAGPTQAAMALADTRNAMVSNMARCLALVGGVLVATAGGKMVWFAIYGFLGDLLALAVCVWRLQMKHGVPAKLCLGPLAAFGFCAGLSVLAVAGGAGKLNLALLLLLASFLLAVQAFGMILMSARLREEVSAVIAKLRTRLSPIRVGGLS